MWSELIDTWNEVQEQAKEREVRLIDVNALKIDGVSLDKETPIVDFALNVIKAVQNAPTIDPEDLRPKANWVPKPTMIRTPWARNYYCSHCTYEPLEVKSYCPNCGYKMEG